MNIDVLDGAVILLTRDLLGSIVRPERYLNAYLVVAYSDVKDLADIEADFFEPQNMRDALVAVFAEQTGGRVELIRAQFNDALAVKALAAKNSIDLVDLVYSRFSQALAPIPNYPVAHAVLSFGPDAPKFADALLYVMDLEHNDVPQAFRAEVSDFFGDVMLEMGFLKQENGTWMNA